MNNISKSLQMPFSEVDFIAKIQKLDKDLSTGKMWMNDRCEMQKKSFRIIRWIKCILSILLPVNLHSSIKASKVALCYYEFIKKHREFLQNENTLKDAKKVLTTLNEKTQDKYFRKIEAYLDAISGLVPVRNITQESPVKQVVNELESSS